MFKKLALAALIGLSVFSVADEVFAASEAVSISIPAVQHSGSQVVESNHTSHSVSSYERHRRRRFRRWWHRRGWGHRRHGHHGNHGRHRGHR